MRFAALFVSRYFLPDMAPDILTLACRCWRLFMPFKCFGAKLKALRHWFLAVVVAKVRQAIVDELCDT